MSIDMAQFHQVFFEDSLEGLAVMETGLMELEPGNADAQTINSIFRAAHSIKGGSGTFGFRVIADFTHAMETLLDQIRDLKREVTRDNTDLLLLAVDYLREMLEAAQAGDEANAERIAQHQREMEQELGNSVSQSDNAQLLQPPSHQPFHPRPHRFMAGTSIFVRHCRFCKPPTSRWRYSASCANWSGTGQEFTTPTSERHCRMRSIPATACARSTNV